MGTACKCCLANNFKKPFIHNTETAHLPLNHGIPNKHQAKQIPCSVDNWLETLFKSHVIPCGLGLLCDFPLVLQIAWRNTRNWQSSPSAPISHPGQRKKKMIWPKTKTANYFSGKSNSKNSLDSKSHENTPINANQSQHFLFVFFTTWFAFCPHPAKRIRRNSEGKSLTSFLIREREGPK